MDEYEFERKVRKNLQDNLVISHSYSLNKRGQKYITVSINWNNEELCNTKILIGQEKDLHDYSEDFKEQILP